MSLPEFKVHEFPDNPPQKRFTFTVGGLPSLFWCPTRHAVERVISRLKLGRSGEAFGGAGLTSAGPRTGYAALDRSDRKARARVFRDGEVVTATVETKSGRQKVRETAPAFLIELDGKTFHGATTEQDAKGVASVGAFMSRGRLGCKEEARAAFKDLTGKDCKIHYFAGKLVAKDSDGVLWWVGIFLNQPLTKKYRFKPVLGTAQLQLGPEVLGAGLRAKE